MPLRSPFTFLALAAFLPVLLPAQQAPSTSRPTAQVGRVAEADAPRIDGALDDKCWANAPALGELVMVEPWEGRVPTQRTVVRLLHDRHNLYIACWCFDDAPGEIRASVRARDGWLNPDDRLEFLLDPFENRRTGYFFQIGAGGSLGDILISGNGSKFDKPWDTIWSGASKVTEQGWLAEIAIPFRSIPRREGASTWGFNMRRYVRTRNEEYQWANPTQAVMFFRVSECGTIEGFGEIDGGVGLEVVPYTTVGVVRDRASADPDWNVDPDAGGEIYYRLTPSMTLATTFLTDFAETEIDERQINLNRFPLFFPEKRDFFLEGAGYYSFGASYAGGATFLPFFTRRIGLADDGTKIPLLAGVKLTGEAGPFEVGLLDVQTGREGAIDEANLAVARIKYAVDEQTTVGVITTNGDPTGGTENQVAGIDFSHRIAQFVGDMDLRITADAVASTGSGAGDDGESFGIDLRSEGREWKFETGMRQVSDDFDPALGFVSRRGSRASAFEVSYEPRLAEGGAIRNLGFDIAIDRRDEWEGATQEVGFAVKPFGLELHSGDKGFTYVKRDFERVDADFELFRSSTTVFVGDYWTTRGGIGIETSMARAWNAEVNLDTGDFFDGRSDHLGGEGTWRLSPLLHVGGGYDTTIVDLGPGRAFTTHIASGRLDLYFSPDLSLRSLVQFDNESNELGWQSRLRWIYAPGCDFFAVLGTTWLREDDGSIAPTEQALQLKVAHSLRF